MVNYSEFESNYKKGLKVADYLMYLVNSIPATVGCRYLLFLDLVEDVLLNDVDLIELYGLEESVSSIDEEDLKEFKSLLSDKKDVRHTELIEFFKSASDYKEVSLKVKSLYDGSHEILTRVSDEIKDIDTDPLHYMTGCDKLSASFEQISSKIHAMQDNHLDTKILKDQGNFTIHALLVWFHEDDDMVELLKQCGIDKPKRKVFSKLERRSFSEDNLSRTALLSSIVSILIESIADAHIFHFLTPSYAAHMALQTYYESMPDKVDALGEFIQEQMHLDPHYMNARFTRDSVGYCPISYFENLKEYLISAQDAQFDSQLQSIYDDIVNEVTELLYRLKNLQ